VQHVKEVKEIHVRSANKVIMDNAKIKDISDLDKCTILELKAVLNARGVRLTGKKSELLRLAKLYFSNPVIGAAHIRDQGRPEQDNIVANADLRWDRVESHSKISVPRGLSITSVTTYLTSFPATLNSYHALEPVSTN
jgi:hypothetical protein